METQTSLKVVVLPWLAMGHLIPFLELSKCLANKGILVTFITTPKNISRLPKIPLSSNLNMISLPFPHLEGVPSEVESSMDVPPTMQPKLKMRFDLLQDGVEAILAELRPDWVLYDFTSHWIPLLSAKVGAHCVYMGLFSAASLAYIGPPSELLENYRFTPEDFAVVPRWVPTEMESSVFYHLHEVMKFMHSVDADMGTPDTVRFGGSIEGCDFVGIRTCFEFEKEWIDLLGKLYGKSVIPIGSLFPKFESKLFDRDFRCEENKEWELVNKWLDEQENDSVLYVALGSESTMSKEELVELARGLELSNLPFLLVLRDPPESTRSMLLDTLPNGFLDRVSNRGMVYFGWAPQFKILSNKSIQGFLTHCGWNSVIEGLGLGRVLVLFPLMNEQALVARLVASKGAGVEVTRDEPHGSLRGESVAKAIRLAMVEKEGEELRANAKKMKHVFGNKELNGHYIDEFIGHLMNYRNQVTECFGCHDLRFESHE